MSTHTDATLVECVGSEVFVDPVPPPHNSVTAVCPACGRLVDLGGAVDAPRYRIHNTTAEVDTVFGGGFGAATFTGMGASDLGFVMAPGYPVRPARSAAEREAIQRDIDAADDHMDRGAA